MVETAENVKFFWNLVQERPAAMIVQIYEIQNPDEAEVMLGLGVDHIGSVVTDPDDWKDPVIRQTIAHVRQSGGRSCLIALTGQMESIIRIIEYYQPDIFHFCDHLDPLDEPVLNTAIDMQLKIKELFPGLELMRTIPVSQADAPADDRCLELARHLEPASDWLLIDTLLVEKRQKSAKQPVEGFIGITGKPCNWDLARRLVETTSIPVILAGGLGPDNAARAVERVKPAGVDSCTLTNAVDLDGNPIRFKKDPDKVRRFVRAVKDMRQERKPVYA